MRAHAEIGVSRIKETRFFCDPGNWHKGLGWYVRLFPKNAKARIESSPSYTNYPTERDVPQRIHAIIPEARFLYVMRDPVDRAISHYISMSFNSIGVKKHFRIGVPTYIASLKTVTAEPAQGQFFPASSEIPSQFSISLPVPYILKAIH